MSTVLGLAVIAAVAWIVIVIGRRVLQADRERDAADALAAADRSREGAQRERAIEVDSPAQIEPRVEREPCVRCGGRVHVDAHEVASDGDEVLRRVLAICGGCGAKSITWFRVRTTLTN